ncbi:unnamed protein product [Closterium sp. NIES-53]
MAQIYKVDIRSGMLFNTDNGSPMAQVGGMGDTRAVAQRAEHSQACRVFQGGNVGHLHHMLHIAAGAQVMYVGDHIFGDILRSKKSLVPPSVGPVDEDRIPEFPLCSPG